MSSMSATISKNSRSNLATLFDSVEVMTRSTPLSLLLRMWLCHVFVAWNAPSRVPFHGVTRGSRCHSVLYDYSVISVHDSVGLAVLPPDQPGFLQSVGNP